MNGSEVRTARPHRGLTALLALALLIGIAAVGVDRPSGAHSILVPPTSASGSRAARDLLASLPITFIANRGQLGPRVAYYLEGGEAGAFFTSRGVTLSLPDAAGGTHRLELAFPGAGATRPVGVDQAPGIVSYFVGPRSDWHTGIPTYRTVAYRGVWPGIDVAFSGDGTGIEYRFVVHPGADPSPIGITYRGAEGLTLTPAGDLQVRTPAGVLTERAPVSFQPQTGRRIAVPSAFTLQSPSHVGIRLGPHDPDRPVVIDPTIAFSGFIGGAGNDVIRSVALDGKGAIYVAGDFSRKHQRTDAFVAKVKRDGSALAYLIYLGGSDRDYGYGLAVNLSGQAYVAGSTKSPDFPRRRGPDLSYNGGFDAFVAKVNPAGTNLLYSGYVGGSDFDGALGIALDKAGHAYIAGSTSSSDFPTQGGPDLTYNGGSDAFVAKVNADGTALFYAGYLGGGDNDGAWGIAVDPSGDIYLAGDAASSDFPTLGGPDLTYNGGFDAFVAKVNPAGTTLLYSGYLGGSDEDQGLGVAVDPSGDAYLVGETASADFPTRGGLDHTFNGRLDAFVAKVKPDGSGLAYSAYLGGANYDSGWGIAVDRSRAAYVAGRTSSRGFPTRGGPDLTHNGAYDAFVAKVNAAGTALVYASYLGGGKDDAGFEIAVDRSGDAYVVGYARSPNFPAIGGPDLTQSGSLDGFVTKIGT
jgi:hypothetical protein